MERPRQECTPGEIGPHTGAGNRAGHEWTIPGSGSSWSLLAPCISAACARVESAVRAHDKSADSRVAEAGVDIVPGDSAIGALEYAGALIRAVPGVLAAKEDVIRICWIFSNGDPVVADFISVIDGIEIREVLPRLSTIGAAVQVRVVRGHIHGTWGCKNRVDGPRQVSAPPLPGGASIG